MRTTVTLDPDVDALLHKLMRERGLSFKEALNTAVRRALLAPRTSGGYAFPAYHLGRPKVPLERALRVAAEMENEEIVSKLSQGR